jgi:phage-related protein
MVDETQPKYFDAVGSSLDDLREFPEKVRGTVGKALRAAQYGKKHGKAKPLMGFGGAGVLEVFEDDDGKAYRAVYTVKFAGVIYLLHAFQKKSKRGRVTPKPDMNLVRDRLKEAEVKYADWCAEQEAEEKSSG